MGQTGKTQKSQDAASDASGAPVLDGSKPLDNMRHERFCQEYAGGCFGNANKAYKQAGYKPKSEDACRTDACRLLTKAHIKSRIAYLRRMRFEQLAIDQTRIMELRLQIVYDKEEASNNKLSALKDIEKALGLAEPDKQDIKLTGAVTVIKFEGCDV